MLNTKHTPGPWAVDERQRVWSVATSVILAEIWTHVDKENSGEAEANARLIAAAPELLAACQQMLEAVDNFHDMDDAVAAIRAAVVKGQGQSA